jgi:hypothetical protein
VALNRDQRLLFEKLAELVFASFEEGYREGYDCTDPFCRADVAWDDSSAREELEDYFRILSE